MAFGMSPFTASLPVVLPIPSSFDPSDARFGLAALFLVAKRKLSGQVEKTLTCVKKSGESNHDVFRALRWSVLKRPQKNTQKWPFLGVFAKNLVLKWGPKV